jgi:hypothetical protein
MSELSWKARTFILSIIAVGLGLSVYNLLKVDWQNFWLLVLTGVAAVAQVYKVEGATHKSSYNLSWVVYGFSFVFLGGPATLFVILVAHLIEWAWHKYPWYIQVFNVASYSVVITVAGFVSQNLIPLDSPFTVAGAMSALLVTIMFTLLNHLMIGMVLKLAREESFTESGVFSYLTLIIDFTMFGVGVVSAFLWMVNPVTILFNIIPLYLFYNALKVPALIRQVEELEENLAETNLQTSQMKAESLQG